MSEPVGNLLGLKASELKHLKNTLRRRVMPEEIVSPELIEELYGLKCAVIENPLAGTPLVIPY